MSDITLGRTSGVTVAETDGVTHDRTSNGTSDGTVRGTYGDTDDDTDEADAGTDSEEAEEEEYEPPCRVAAKYLTNCPHCARRVSIRTLRYTHVCGRTFRSSERALEQQEVAKTKMLQRSVAANQVSLTRNVAKSAMLNTSRPALDIGAPSTGVARCSSGKLPMRR
jgi:hypothetical protein